MTDLERMREDMEKEINGLREENQRLYEETTAMRFLQEENARLLSECHRLIQCADRNVVLEAQVAALVRFINMVRHAPTATDMFDYMLSEDCVSLVDTPDLAALVAREQARDAVVKQAGNVVWAMGDRYQRNLEAHLEHLKADLDALRALDAAEEKK